MTEKARRLSLQDSVPGALSSRAASRTERSSSCTSAELLVLELLELRYGALVDAVDEEEWTLGGTKMALTLNLRYTWPHYCRSP